MNSIFQKLVKIKMLNEGSDDSSHQDALDQTGFWGKKGAGSLVLSKDTNRFLIAKRSRYVQEPGTWGTWGGAIDSNEDPKKAALREFQEECGYKGNVVSQDLLFVWKAPQGTFQYYNYLLVIPKEFTPKLDWETETSGWFEWGKFPKPLHFGLENILKNREAISMIQKRMVE